VAYYAPGMGAKDFCGIGRSAQEDLRWRVLFLIERQGLSQAQAAEVVGMQRQTVNTWLKRYRAQEEAGVLDGRRFRRAAARGS
jgi:transposase